MVAGVAIGHEVAAAETDRSAIRVADREDDPLAEPVVSAATARSHRHEADLGELLRPDVPLLFELAGHRVPAARRPADLEAGDGLVGEAADAEVVERWLAELRARQDDVVEGNGALENLAQAGPAGVVTGRPLVDLDAGLRGQGLERLGKADAVTLHDEAEDVTTQTAAEALPALPRRSHDEARSLLAMERAQALEGRAGLPQLDRLADDVRDLEAALDFRGDSDRHRHLRPQPVLPDRRVAGSGERFDARRAPDMRPAGHDCGPVKS